MPAKTFLKPEKILVNRSQLRQNQRGVLSRARGRTIVVVTARSAEDERYVLGRQYFDEILKSWEAVLETLEITMDRKLFEQILAAADTLERDLRMAELHSFEEAFAEH